MCLLAVVSEELEAELVFIFLTFNLTFKVTFISNFQETQKLLQPVDKTRKTMAIEFAEYQMYYYHPFYALSDPAKLYNDLRWNVTRPQGFEAVMRVRCKFVFFTLIFINKNIGMFIPSDFDVFVM
ncbi:hypothetical protein Hdeb2414_s0022g00610371 [Helianthus debilis subsp. tardiflorus]